MLWDRNGHPGCDLTDHGFDSPTGPALVLKVVGVLFLLSLLSPVAGDFGYALRWRLPATVHFHDRDYIDHHRAAQHRSRRCRLVGACSAAPAFTDDA
jgi:hypothetical protein